MERVEKAIARYMECDLGPHGVLTSGSVERISSGLEQVTWTSRGGCVLCSNEEASGRIAELVESYRGTDYLELAAEVRRVVSEHYPEQAFEEFVVLYWPPSREPETSARQDIVEIPVEEVFVNRHPLAPKVEGCIGIRDGSTILSWSNSVMLFELDGHEFHSVGVHTHEGCRRQGLGKAVVLQMLRDILSEGDVAIWQCAARNLRSLLMARSMGFTEYAWTVRWKPADPKG